MRRHRRYTIHFGALTTVTMLVFCGGLTANSAAGADKKDVTLTFTVDSAGASKVTVHPETAEVWRNKPDKPKKVNWVAVNNSPYSELFWELRYEPGKGGASENYFGNVDLACGKTEIKVQPDKKPAIASAQWPYSISVFTCVDGAKGEKLAEVDPRIVWKD